MIYQKGEKAYDAKNETGCTNHCSQKNRSHIGECKEDKCYCRPGKI